MKNHRLNRLVQLNAIADKALEIKFAHPEEDEESGMGGKLVAGGGLAAAGYGAYKGRQAVINKYGVTDDFGNRVARRGMYGDAARGEIGAVSSKLKSGIGAVKDTYGEARKGPWGSGAQVGQRLGRGRVASAGVTIKALLSKLRK